jgi:uncharacterized protein (DUF1778 family)
MQEDTVSKVERIIDLHVAVRLKDEAWERYLRALDALQQCQSQGTK